MKSDYAIKLTEATISIAPILRDRANEVAHALALLGYTNIRRLADDNRSPIIAFSDPETPVTVSQIAKSITPDPKTVPFNEVLPVLHVDHDKPEEGQIQLRLTAEM